MGTSRLPNASRFEVFNTETGEAVFDSHGLPAVWSFPVPEASPRRRGLAFARAREYVLGSPQKPLAVRLWEKGNPVPTIVYSPHNL